MNVSERVLQKVAFGVQREVSSIALMDTEFSVDPCELRDAMVYSIRTKVWGEYLDGADVSFPANWKEALKERWAPEWLKKRKPVVFKTIETRFTVLYPEYKAIVDGERYNVMSITREDYEYWKESQ